MAVKCDLWHFWAVDKETLIKSRGFVDKETVDKESGKCVDKESGEMTFDKETLIKRREAKASGFVYQLSVIFKKHLVGVRGCLLNRR